MPSSWPPRGCLRYLRQLLTGCRSGDVDSAVHRQGLARPARSRGGRGRRSLVSGRPVWSRRIPVGASAGRGVRRPEPVVGRPASSGPGPAPAARPGPFRRGHVPLRHRRHRHSGGPVAGRPPGWHEGGGPGQPGGARRPSRRGAPAAVRNGRGYRPVLRWCPTAARGWPPATTCSSWSGSVWAPAGSTPVPGRSGAATQPARWPPTRPDSPFRGQAERRDPPFLGSGRAAGGQRTV